MSTTRPGPAYTYTAVVVRVVDGDSLHLDVDLGFNVWLRDVPFRLAGCNARELSTPGGPEARDHLTALLPAGTVVTVRSVKTDKYARWDADVILPPVAGVTGGPRLTDILINGGWAAPWTGAGTAPVPPWPRTNEATGANDFILETLNTAIDRRTGDG